MLEVTSMAYPRYPILYTYVMEIPANPIKTPEPESYIRPYNSSDHDEVVSILMENESYEPYDHDESSFEQTQEDWGEESVLVHVRSFEHWRAVTGIARIAFMGPGQRKARIGDLSVLPDEQGYGIGSKLLEAMKNVCYKRRCLPELLTNADVPPEMISTSLVDWYRARGFDDPYSAVGLIGDELPRARGYDRPNAAYKLAASAIDRVHGTLLSWGHELACTVDDKEIQGGYPDFFKDYVRVHHPGAEAAFDRHNLLVGHPSTEHATSQESQNIEVWSAVKTEFEDIKILRRLSLPRDFYMQENPPRANGEYVFRFPDSETGPWFEVVKTYNGNLRRLAHTSNQLQQILQQRDIRRGWNSISTPGEILTTLYSLIHAQNTLDDRHRYDRRWCGEVGYPSFPGPSRNHWSPDVRLLFGDNRKKRLDLPDGDA